MKEIVRKSHEKEIAYELSKKSYPDKTGRGGYFSPPPVQIGLTQFLLNVVFLRDDAFLCLRYVDIETQFSFNLTCC